MEATVDQVTSLFPQHVPIFGNTHLTRVDETQGSFTSYLQVRIPFVGKASGELLIWSDLCIEKLRPNERAYARGVIGEAANILAGMTLSELADKIDGKIMLAPPHIIDNKTPSPIKGHDYILSLLDGKCRCRVEVTLGALQ